MLCFTSTSVATKTPKGWRRIAKRMALERHAVEIKLHRYGNKTPRAWCFSEKGDKMAEQAKADRLSEESRPAVRRV